MISMVLFTHYHMNVSYAYVIRLCKNLGYILSLDIKLTVLTKQRSSLINVMLGLQHLQK